MFADLDRATAVVRSAKHAVTFLPEGELWKIKGDDLLASAQELATLAHTVYAVTVHLAGEIDAQELAATRARTSTARCCGRLC